MITSDAISKLEASRGYKLPASYKAILLNPPGCVLWMWTGSDWGYPNLSELDDLTLYANKLLEVTGHQLKRGDFVFHMHQGYVFLYMKSLDENDDPEVWGFCEGDEAPQKIGDSFTSWFADHCRTIEKERAVIEMQIEHQLDQAKKEK